VLHAGEWIRRGAQLTGPDVIVIHRLLKNHVEGSGYVLMTESFAASYGLSPEQLGLSLHVERYDDVGEVRCFVGELERRYLEERDRRRLAVTAEDSALAVERFLPVPPAAAWELLTAPGKRLLWQVEDIEEAQAGARRCTGTASVCVDGRTKIYEEILDWRPFEYFTESRTPAGGARFLLTTTLTPTDGGTAVRLLGRPDGGRARPFAARRLARRSAPRLRPARGAGEHGKGGVMLTGFQANLKAPDLDEVVEFYGGKLGLPIVDRRSMGPGHGDVVIGVGEDATICVEVGEGGRADTPIGFEVEDVEAIVDELRRRGVEPEEYDLPSIKTVNGIASWGDVQAAWIKDPGGNLIGIVTRVRSG
jgi:uncharacterized protein YndB with AHSA1/START domain/catechol 2,3-dioxygenase-like lactoylglutathione lyase family enzyme